MLAPYIIAIVMDCAAFAADNMAGGVAAGWILLAEAAVLGIYFYRRERCLASFRLLLSVFWIGGEGLAAFRLSYLQKEWTTVTWLCFSLFYLVFLMGYDLVSGITKNKKHRREKGKLPAADFQKRLFHCILVMTVIPAASFLFEALKLGYIPLFSTETHAYDHFHVSGVHYFTVSCMFVPALSTIWLLNLSEKAKKKERWILAVCNLAAFAIPVLCVSKFQIALAIVLPVLLFLLMRPEIPGKYLIAGIGGIAAALAAVTVFMTVSRHYPPGHLNSVFEMRDENMPVMFQYIYMYIANNYANFNELTMSIGAGRTEFAWGMRELFPLFALTGLKFVFPQLVQYPAVVTKEVLNTLTIIYDAYYDFGIAGVVAFGAVLGAVCGWLRGEAAKGRNPMIYLFYGQIAMYLMLSFFSAWFTVPTTWFWFAVTGILYFYTSGSFPGIEKKKKL